MPKHKSMTDVLRERLTAEFESGASLRTIESEVGVIRQSLVKFIRGEQSLRLDLADRLAARYQLELRPATRRKGQDR
jgi:plasmid maintenance system antidote protein VapI